MEADVRRRPERAFTTPARPLRIVHVITRYLRGGSEARLLDLTRALPDADHYLICGLDSAIELARSRLDLAGSFVEPSLVREPNPAKDLRALRRLKAFLRAHDVDLVVTHQSKAGALGRLAARTAGRIPVIHSLSMPSFGPGYPWWQDRLFRFIEARLAGRTHAYAVVGQDLASRYVSCGIPPHKMTIVRSSVRLPPNGETDLAARRSVRVRFAVPEGRPLVLYVGSLEPRKNVLDLPRFLTRLHVHDAATRPFLLVAGEGPLAGELAERFASADLDQDARVVGYVPVVGPLIAAADVVVLLSRVEGISQVLVQASAAGTPFVAYDVDGTGELIEMGADGVIVPIDDVEGAARAASSILRRGEDGRSPVDLSEWEPDVIADGYRGIVRAVIGLGPGDGSEPREGAPASDASIGSGEDHLEGRPEQNGRGLTRKASLNALAGTLDNVARVVVEFVINPILVNGLGTYLYGAWRVLWRWTGYVWATSGRSAQALQSVIANRQRTADPDEKRGYVASAIAVWFLFLPILLGLGAAGIWAAPHVLATPEHLTGAVRWAAALLVADAALLTLLTVPKAVLQGENLGYKRIGLSTALMLSVGGLMALAVALELGIAGVAMANLIGTILTGVLFWRVARRFVPWFGVSRPRWAGVRWFLGLSWWFTGWKIVNQAMLAGDVLVLGIAASVEQVTTYSMTRYVPEALMVLLITAVLGASPGLGGLIGAGDLAKAREIRSELMRMTWLITTAAGTSILMWNSSFVGLWVGEGLFAGDLASLLILVMIIQFTFIRTDAQIIDLTLRLKHKVILAALATSISLALGTVAVTVFDGGIAGLAAGIIIGRLILSASYPWLVGRALQQPLGSQLPGVVRPVAVTTLLFAGAIAIRDRATADTWIELVMGSGATAIVAAALAAVLGVTASQRTQIGRRVARIARVR